MEKECTSCHEIKPYSEYSKGNHKATKLRYTCKRCDSKAFINYKNANLETERERKREWGASAAGKYNTIKYGTKRKELLVSKEDFVEWYNNEPKYCHYCGIPEDLLNKLSDRFNRKCRNLSIDRLNTDKPYTLDNMVLACLRCNWIKSDFFTEDEMKEIAEKYVKPKWKINKPS